MLRVLCAILLTLSLVGSVRSEERPHGLLWNRTGAPATLPLQIKTDAGADYVLFLAAAESDAAVFAAYIRGGAFFRVLVPPGQYRLQFATGSLWFGEDELFGPQTLFFTLEPPLQFRASATRKEGHLIDLRDDAAFQVRSLADCQRLELDPNSLRGGAGWVEPLRLGTGEPLPPPERFPTREYQVRPRVCG
ncbi:hypothetical protein [Shimia sp.]|uniref:hypothetical protein n=1 Tax=Shimia sp. TaxID=1954381 RepID=UPI003B8AAD97